MPQNHKYGVINIHASFSELTDTKFTIPTDSPQNDSTLKMPTMEWIHL